MNILGWGLGLLIPGGGIAALAIRFLAPTLFSSIAGPVVGGAKAGWSFVKGLDPRTIVAGLAVFAVAFLYAEHRHDRKVIAGDEAWSGGIMAEVNRAHGCEPLRSACAVDKADAAARIHQLTDNARGWRADVEAQNTSQRSSAASAAARDAAARAGAATTAEQKAREQIRAGLRAPDRKTGVSSNEWSKM